MNLSLPATHRLAWLPVLILVLVIDQLAVAEWVPGIDRFAGKAFGARLIAYPVLMLLVPAGWWLLVRRRDASAQAPYAAFSLVMLPFLVDVTGNSFDMYDSITWWDDANHFLNWLLLLSGIGLVCFRGIRPRWAMIVQIAGLGALLAVVWELGEYETFIRNGTELKGAYQDTLGDEALGSLGALLAGFLVAFAPSYAGATPMPEQPAPQLT